jgi:hypothetical protein
VHVNEGLAELQAKGRIVPHWRDTPILLVYDRGASSCGWALRSIVAASRTED